MEKRAQINLIFTHKFHDIHMYQEVTPETASASCSSSGPSFVLGYSVSEIRLATESNVSPGPCSPHVSDSLAKRREGSKKKRVGKGVRGSDSESEDR